MWNPGDLLESQITFDCYRIVKIDPNNNWIRVRLYYETTQVSTRITALASAGYKKVKLPTVVTKLRKSRAGGKQDISECKAAWWGFNR